VRKAARYRYRECGLAWCETRDKSPVAAKMARNRGRTLDNHANGISICARVHKIRGLVISPPRSDRSLRILFIPQSVQPSLPRSFVNPRAFLLSLHPARYFSLFLAPKRNVVKHRNTRSVKYHRRATPELDLRNCGSCSG